MKLFGFKRLAGLALAAAVLGGPLGAPAYAQTPAPAPAAEAAAPAPEAAAPVAEAVAVAVEAAPAAPATPVPDKGDNAWMMVSAVLVLLMIVPGLALFYGGLVRQKNMLSMLMQTTTVCVIGMMAWCLWGYSLAFTDGGAHDAFFGGTGRLFLKDVTPASVAATFSTGVYIPELTFIGFQMTFAAITACLVLGGVAERMKFSAVVIFAVLWPLLSYYPMAHMVWWWPGPDSIANAPKDAVKSGLLWGWGALDFAGGTVVHINAGDRGPHGRPDPRSSEGATAPSRCSRTRSPSPWSAPACCGSAGSASTPGPTWKPTATPRWPWSTPSSPPPPPASPGPRRNGSPARRPRCWAWRRVWWRGLVAVTPAAGFAGPMGALVLGLVVSPICVFFCSAVKNALKYDDSLDAFGIHAIGGIVGALATGILVAASLGGAGIVDYTTCAIDGDISTCDALASYTMMGQFITQLKAVAVAVVWSAVASSIVFFIIKFTVGLRVSEDTEEEGLDIAEHGERAYHA